MTENIRLSFRGIWSHKMRSFLTMLGIIIGIAAIIAIVSTIQGTNEQIKQNLIGAGSSTVDIVLSEDDWEVDSEYNELPASIKPVSELQKQAILQVKNLDAASYYHKRGISENVKYLTTSASGGYLIGTNPDYFNTCGYIMKEGRVFTEADEAAFKNVCVIDSDMQTTLFSGESAVGKFIEIKSTPYEIIGVVRKANAYTPKISSMQDYYMYANENSGYVFVPDSTWPEIYGFDEPEYCVAKAATVDDMSQVGKDVQEILNLNITTTGDSNVKYKANDILEQAKEIQQLSQSTNKMLIWIAAISLLVGGIGVMNIMLVSVTERTNEIGLKKAIGARKSKIMLQFLTESVVLTSIGGFIGVIIGIVLAKIISLASGTVMAISPIASVGAVLFSMFIGIVFGILPSRKAANLDPIDALRHE